MFGSNTGVSTLPVKGHDIAFALRPGGEQCIVFLHGLGCSKESFAEAFTGSYFPDRYTLLAPDFIGHGESSKPHEYSYDLADQSDLLISLLNDLAIDKIAIIAHSMGNVPGLLLTKKSSGLFKYFCLEGNMCRADCGISARIAKFSEQEFVDKFFTPNPQRFRCPGPTEQSAANPFAFYRSARSLLNWVGSERLLPLYMGLNVEKAYLRGARSKVASVIADLNSKEVVEIAGAGHFLMNDNPDMTYGEIAGRL